MDVLRDASINISSDEVLSLFNALPHVSLLDRGVFRQTLKTTLVKDYTDIPMFDRCFDEFFSIGGDIQVRRGGHLPGDERPGDAPGAGRHAPEEDVADLEQAIADFIDRLPDDAILGNGPGGNPEPGPRRARAAGRDRRRHGHDVHERAEPLRHGAGPAAARERKARAARTS